jgi:hypothetical protein
MSQPRCFEELLELTENGSQRRINSSRSGPDPLAFTGALPHRDTSGTA